MSIKTNYKILAFIFLYKVFSSFSVFATSNELMWSEGACLNDSANNTINHGANRSFYNSGAHLKWQNYLGDWSDSFNNQLGNKPYDEIMVIDEDEQQTVALNATNLVNKWLNNEIENQGFFIRTMTLDGPKFDIYSKDHANDELRPKLLLNTSAGKIELEANADTVLRAHTHQCAGDLDLLRVLTPVLIYFDLSTVDKSINIYNAELLLKTTERQYGNTLVQLYSVNITGQRVIDDSLANQFPNDFEMKYDNRVMLVESFESDNWQNKWSNIFEQSGFSLRQESDMSNFESLSGRAISMTIKQGEYSAGSLIYDFEQQLGNDVEEIYFRYYLRLSDSWQPTDSGKLPGIAGTYANTQYEGGWGGRRSTGENGWSMRGLFTKPVEGENNPLKGTLPVGNYMYHSEQIASYGDENIFQSQPLKYNMWYSIEQYVQLNTPGQNNGIVRNWINGILVYENTSIKFRNEGYEHIKIDQVWVNLYHGGKTPAPYDMTAYIDNLVIANQYIGPIKYDASLPVAGSEVNKTPVIQSHLPLTNSLSLGQGEKQEFEIVAIDPENENLTIQWSINGVPQKESSDYFTFYRDFTSLEEITVEVHISDAEGAHTSHSWSIASEIQNWRELQVSQDTYLPTWTYTARGTDPIINLNNYSTAMLKFSVNTDIAIRKIKGAYLVLTDIAQYGAQTLSVYRGMQSWHEGSSETDGATREYSDYSNQVPWESYLGDWRDANGYIGGTASYGEYVLADTDNINKVYLDITELLIEEISSSNSVNITLKSAGGKHEFGSKEHEDTSVHPMIIIELYE